MRRLDEELVEAPTHTGAGASPGTRLRDVAPLYTFALGCYLLAPYLGLDSRDVDPRIAEVWPPGGVGFVLVTTVWYAGRRVVATTLGVMALAFCGTAVALDYSLGMSLWLALAGVAQPVMMAWLYRRTLSHGGWAPRSPRDIGALFSAALLSSLALGLVGGYPFLTPDDLPSKVLLWWVLRNTVFCFVGGATFMVIYYSRRTDVLPPSSWVTRVGLLVTAFLCVYGTYHDPSLPLSWLLIVPSVWGGLTLTVRGTAFLALTVALIAAAMTYLPQNQFGYTGLLPAASIVDTLVIASTAFTLLLALMREQRGALIAELDHKGAEAESQRSMLSTVFDSMKDGVVILDDGRVTLHNAAARQLLGRRVPRGSLASWARALDLRATDGAPLDGEELRETLLAPESGAGPRTMEVLVGRGGPARVLELSAQPVGAAADGPTMLLLHDVTAERARLRELVNFAGMVAHDLRGPLTVLDGWLEVVEDRDSDQHPEYAADALGRARDSSRRMGQVIDDWLNYTVVQNGQLHPDALKLGEVTSEIVESRESHWADGDAPRFQLDLTHSVLADPAMLRQLLDNLIGNAIKYTAVDQAPWVQIVSMADTEAGWVRVEVTDRGIGIPEGQEELIFAEFHRGPVEGRTPGSGLGLALTRRIVELHGGELTARRNPEGGSTFSFTLPEA
jgi:signal transduction histidine kinase